MKDRASSEQIEIPKRFNRENSVKGEVEMDKVAQKIDDNTQKITIDA